MTFHESTPSSNPGHTPSPVPDRPSKTSTIQLIMQAHKGQTRWFTNEPYYQHPLRVASHVALVTDDEDVIHAAMMHDVLEDTDWTADDLRAAGYSDRVLELLDILTHREDERYMEYVARICKDPDAVTIKKADISDNLATLPTGKSMAYKYIRALSLIHEDGIVAGG